jgi:hypothetical protein
MKRHVNFFQVILALACVLVNFSKFSAQTAISPKLFSQNAWYVDAALTDPSDAIDPHWQDVASSGVQYVRIGGINLNWFPLYTWVPPSNTVGLAEIVKLKNLITKIRDMGMEPVVTVGYHPLALCQNSTWPFYGLNLQQQADIAARVVVAINNEFPGEPVLNWIVANEPNIVVDCNSPKGYGYSSLSDAAAVATYIKTFSSTMKTAYPGIRIWGPEVAGFSTSTSSGGNQLMNALLSTDPNTGILGKISSNPDIYYVDVVSIHAYPDYIDRTEIITKPSTNNEEIKARLTINTSSRKGVIPMITTNTTRTPDDLTVAVTEFNIDDDASHLLPFRDDSDPLEYFSLVNDDGSDGNRIDNRSFVAGQWLAETFSLVMDMGVSGKPWVESMNLWSIREGSDCNEGYGYISQCTGNKRSSYWHFKMLANYFTGGSNYKNLFQHGIDNSSSTDISGIKTFGCHTTDNSSVALGQAFIVIINQEDDNGGNTYDYSLKLNGTPALPSYGTNKMTLAFNMGLNYTVSSSGPSYPNRFSIAPETTQLLVFDCNGAYAGMWEYSVNDNLNNNGPRWIPPSPVPTPALNVTFTFTPNPIPSGTPADFDFNGADHFSWFPDPLLTVQNPDAGGDLVELYAPASSQPDKDYYYIATASNGCTSTQKVSITGAGLIGGPPPSSIFIETATASCAANHNGTALILGDVSSYTYVWSNGETGSNPTQLPPGINSCVATHTVTSATILLKVDIPTAPANNTIPTVTPSGGPNCNITLTSSSANGYQWYKSSAAISGATLVSYNTSVNGSYTVRVANSSGCLSQHSAPYNFTTGYEYPNGKTLSASETWSTNTKVNNTITIPNGVQLDIDPVTVSFGNQGKIVVEPGGILALDGSILNHYTACATTWLGIEVQPGGTLIMNNSTVNLNGNGKILVDHNGTTAGNLHFNLGSILILNDPTTIAEIKGNLHIGTNSVFGFTGNGFVRFNMPGTSTANIFPATGAQIYFDGGANAPNTKKLVEILQESVYANSPMSLFTLKNGAAYLAGNARLSVDCPITMDNAMITSIATGPGNQHLGLWVYGQNGMSITNSIFENGVYGLTALLTTGGNDLVMGNCTFRNNATGLYSSDKAVLLNNCRLINNSFAWEAYGMTNESEMHNGQIKDNDVGVYFHGSTTSGLYFYNPYVYNNQVMGIEYNGSGTLSARCGTIGSSSGTGISLRNGAALNMSPSQVPAGGSVIATNNSNTINGNFGGLLLLDQGRNTLVPFPGTFAVSGTFAGYCGSSAIIANNNKWNLLNLAPVNTIDYSIATHGCRPNKPLLIQDDAPGSFACAIVNPRDELLGLIDGTPCDLCPDINTSSFVSENLGNAVLMSMVEVADGDYLAAINLFNEILTAGAPVTSETEYYLELAYNYMNYSVGEAYKSGLLSTADGIGSEVRKLLNIQSAWIGQYAQDTTYYPQLMMTSMDRAQVHRTAGSRDSALILFNDVLSWAKPQDVNDVTLWKCITSTEISVISGAVAKEDFKTALTECTGSNLRSIQENITADAGQYEKVSIHPNPNNGQFTMRTNFSGTYTITVHDVLGNQVSSMSASSPEVKLDVTAQPKGIYLVKVYLPGGKVKVQKLIIQ